MGNGAYSMAKRIDVVDQAILVLTDLKTQELIKAVEAQDKALQELAGAIRKYADWVQEQIVRLDGER